MALKNGFKVAGETQFSIDDNGDTATDWDRWNGGTEISIGGNGSWAAQDVNLYDYSRQQPTESHGGEMWILCRVWLSTGGNYIFHNPGVQLQMRPSDETHAVVPGGYIVRSGYRFWIHMESCKSIISSSPTQLVTCYSMASNMTSSTADSSIPHAVVRQSRHMSEETDYSSTGQGPRLKFPTWSGGTVFGVKINSYWR